MIPGGELESIHDCMAAAETTFPASNSSCDAGLEGCQKEELPERRHSLWAEQWDDCV